MSQARLGKYHAVLPPGPANDPFWWKLAAPLARRSRRLRAAFFDLPRGRLRTALLVEYYRHIVADMDAGSVTRQFPAIEPDATVRGFGMENFRGPEGAQRLLDQWLETFPGLSFQMSEFINPNATDVLCVLRSAGDGAASGAAVAQEIVFGVKVVDGMAVELSFWNSKRDALAAVGLSE